MTSSDDHIDSANEPQVQSDPPADAGRSVGRVAADLVRRHGRIARSLALLTAAAVVACAYVVGGPPSTDAATHTTSMPGASLAPAYPAGANIDYSLSDKNMSGLSTNQGAPAATSGTSGSGANANPVVSSVETTQIVKTGHLSLEVSGLDSAVNQAQATIVALGGSVDSSNRSGTDEYATASITFRVPVARWDDALSDLRKIGSKVLSEQTNSSDVTSQAIDLDARISNLQTTETALQSIMARASAIPDVIAVENQLSDTQGQIEELTAQRDHLKDQAAMSTLTVTFQLPSKSVVTQATQDWTLSGQIDQAGAALVRIGQGLATIGIWILVVVLPLGLALLLLLGFVVVARRILGRGGRKSASAAV